MSIWKSFAVTKTGASHLKHGKGCEDYSLNISLRSSVMKKWYAEIAIVADGHGSNDCFRSAKGAELAANCAKAAIKQFYVSIIKNSISPSAQMPSLIKNIIKEWHEKVDADIAQNAVTEAELEKVSEKYRQRFERGENLHHAYGTTLIAAAITADYWFGIHIGDGRFTALYADGSFDQPVPWDERCYLNVTTSICDDDAVDTARCYVSYHKDKAPPLAVFLCSDGVYDNYPVECNEQHLFKLYRTIALTFVEDGYDSTCAQLQDLANSFATKGKSDDTSIAGFIDMEGIKRAAPIWRQQIAFGGSR
ncbi:MAG: PP2C family serine/threonine-protein phosphatase [Termitinemataceae bacterium]|nr:MAG: PP2C family serine/threonine-protein phosphatase [Termitinemataceae bacterium]